MFLSARYGLYNAHHPITPSHPHAEVRILPKSLYGKNANPGEAPHSFFSHWYGSSWHADDADFITFLGSKGTYLMYAGMIVTVVFGFNAWRNKNGGSGSKRLRSLLGRVLETGRGQYQMVAIAPSRNEDLEAFPISPDASDSDGETSRIVDLARRTGLIILAVPATFLASPSTRRQKRAHLQSLFSPTTSTSPSQRSRPRTASMAMGLPNNSRQYRPAGDEAESPSAVTPPPPYDKNKEKDEAMDEVDEFLRDADSSKR